MTFAREPRLLTVPVSRLRPTQMTVGRREVDEKRRHWRVHKHKADFLGSHVIPVILGARERYYLIDHHHLALALIDEGLRALPVALVSDLSALDKSAFWTYLDSRAWMHPYDEHGVRRSYDALPKRIGELRDDPYRSLAGELRHRGGFAKDTTPFSEFLWADFLRRRVPAALIRKRFPEALKQAYRLARSQEAGYLPGWCGPIER